VSERIPPTVRVVLVAKGLTPPYLWALLKRAKRRLRPSSAPQPEPAPAVAEQPPVVAEQPSVPEPAPEWEYVPEGFRRQVGGWDVATVAAAYAGKWPSYLRALDGPGPLGLNHEVPLGQAVDRFDRNAHNTIVSYAYVLALAAQRRDRLSILDWGGGLGHYEPLSRALLPGVELEYHCKELPAMVERADSLLPHVHFHDDDSCLARRYELVLVSGSLQYGEDWRALLAALARAADPYLYVTRLPVALAAPSFVVLQRAHRYGYETEYVGWVVGRSELLDAAAAAGLELVREFLLAAWLSARGAPEQPVEHRGYLFRAG
jgi:putative methyltransferase (TIGR04325 family)